MNKIQLITYQPKDFMVGNNNIEISNFNNLKALDNYDVNVFDLSNTNIWKNKSSKNEKANGDTIISSDLKSIKTMIQNSKKTKVLICLPQNVKYRCDYYDEVLYYQLKDILDVFSDVLEQMISFAGVTLVYENNNTKIGKYNVNSSFYFYGDMFEKITVSNDSEKTTTIRYKNTTITALDILNDKNCDLLISYLSQTNLLVSKQEYPDWLYAYNFHDDEQQRNLIEQAKVQIKIQKEIIEKANDKLFENLKYKSILCTNSEQLVDVVFEILEYIFDISLSDFNDEKREDFLFKKNNITFLGEIKGVTTNVKYEHISQLEVHYSKYLDKLTDEGLTEDIKKILIMDYERNRDVKERNEINQMQIDLATKNDTLIIDTESLLKVYEKILNGSLTKEIVVSYITNNSGLIDVSNIV